MPCDIYWSVLQSSSGGGGGGGWGWGSITGWGSSVISSASAITSHVGQ